MNITQRLNIIRQGNTTSCPFCKMGKLKPINDYALKCDACKKGIVGRVDINKTHENESK